MKSLKVISFLFLLLFYCCSSSNNTNNEPKTLSGRLFMTGNDPFARISLVVDANTVYVLEGKEETLRMLKAHQGEYADISYSRIIDSPEGKALEITDAVVRSQDKKQ